MTHHYGSINSNIYPNPNNDESDEKKLFFFKIYADAIHCSRHSLTGNADAQQDLRAEPSEWRMGEIQKQFYVVSIESLSFINKWQILETCTCAISFVHYSNQVLPRLLGRYS